MNAFLLSLTAILILVLSALFAAPLFIDWNDYRPVFETQASKLLGRDVKVGGDVRLVLLPAPELRFDAVRVADQNGGFEQPLLEAKSIEAWLNVGALLTGAVEARKIAISDPVLRLALNPDGTGNWNDIGRPGEKLPFAPKEVALDQVSVSGGRIELARPGEPPHVFEQVEGTASAASLSGPYKATATYRYAGRQQELRFSTGAADAEGSFHLKSVLRDPDRDSTYLLEGDVTGLNERPAYSGAVVYRVAASLPPEAQATGAQSAAPAAPPEPSLSQETPAPAESETMPAGQAVSALELKGQLEATPDHAELPAFELAIHAKGRSQMLKGKLAVDFGERPKAEGELSARWLDADALLAEAGQGDLSVSGALSTLAERVLAEAAKVEEGALALNIDQASIGGDLIGNIELAITAKDGSVGIDRLKAELPGENRLEASGRLARGENGPEFEGPIKIEGSKLRTLTRWAAGDRDASGQPTMGAFSFAASATLGGDGFAFKDASGELSGTKFSGALRYQGGERRVVELDLDSDRLDLREVLGDDVAWRAWLPASAVKSDDMSKSEQGLLSSLRDDEVHARLHVGALLLPNIPPGRLDAKFTLAKDTLDVESLDFASEGAIALRGNGRIESLSDAPAGRVDFALQAATPEGLRVAGEILGVPEDIAKSKNLAVLAPLDIEGGLTAARDGDATSASAEIKGKAAGADVSILLKAKGEPAKLADAEIDFDATVEGERPEALLGLLVPGLATGHLAAAHGKLSLTAQGVPAANVTGRAELATAALQAAFEGQGSLKPEGLVLAGKASAKSENAGLALLLLGLEASPSASSVPLDLRADVAKTGGNLDLTSMAGEIAGEAIAGNAHFSLGGEKTRFSLDATAGSASLPTLLGALVAWRQTPATEDVLGTIAQGASDLWPARSFALDPLTTVEGEIKLAAKKLTLGAPFPIEDAVLIARIDQEGLSVTDLKGRLFGGSFSASGMLSPRGAGAELKARAELTAGKLEQVSQGLAGRVLAKGPFTLSFNVTGEGLSPPGLVAGLSGEGSLRLAPGALQALSSLPLRRVSLEAARGKKIKLDKDQVAAQANALREGLTRGTFPYAAVELPFEVKNGTLKFKPAALVNQRADTTVNGYIELASLKLDSEWMMRLTGTENADVPGVSLILAGSLANAGAITPTVDTAPVESFLTMRRMQEDVERLETLDVSGRKPIKAETPAGASGPDPAAAQAAEQAADEKRLAEERAAAEQAAAEKAAEEKRLAEEKAAVEKAAEEKRLAEERAAAEKAAAEERLAEEQRAAEAKRLAEEKRRAENKRLAEEKAAADAKAAAEKAAEERRVAEERRLAEEKAAAEAKAAAEKAAEERRLAEKKRLAEEKAAAEAKAAAVRAAEAKRLADEKRLAEEKAAAEETIARRLAEEKAAADAKAQAEKNAEQKALAAKAAAANEEAIRTAPVSEAAATPVAAPSPGAAQEQLPWLQGAAPLPEAAPSLETVPPTEAALPPQAAPPAETVAPAEAGPFPPLPARPDATAEEATPVAPRRVRRPAPREAPDDWKKGISIFGGG